jgi:ABC-type hemin transport system ATPase subunit
VLVGRNGRGEHLSLAQTPDATTPLIARLARPRSVSRRMCSNWSITRLSTGERQRLALVRLLAQAT